MHAQKVHQAKARQAWMITAACITALAILGAAPLLAAQASTPPSGLASVPGADVTVSETITSPVSKGEPVELIMTVTNIGDQAATGVTLYNNAHMAQLWQLDPAVPGCTLNPSTYVVDCAWDTLAPSASIQVRLVTQHATDGCQNPTHTIYNNASVTATNDVNTANNTSQTASLEIRCTTTGITVATSPPSGGVNGAEPIGFTIQVTNAGPGAALGVTVSDTLPDNSGLQWTLGNVTVPSGTTMQSCAIAAGPPQVLTCTFDRLAGAGSGAGSAITIPLTSPTTHASCGQVVNTAHVSTTNDGSGQASASITVHCPALDVRMEPIPAGGTANAGDQVGFTIKVSNVGDSTANGVTITDTMAMGTGLYWYLGDLTWPDDMIGGCAINSDDPQELNCYFEQLAPGADNEITIQVISQTTLARACTTLYNTALVSAANAATNIEASASVAFTCADLSITKAAQHNQVDAGSPIHYDITVSNSGLSAAGPGWISDTLPDVPGLSWQDTGVTVTAPPDAGISCAIDRQVAPYVLYCEFERLDAGAQIIVGVESTTTTDSCGVISNKASAAAENAGSVETTESLITVNCPQPPATTAQITPITATCGDFKAQTAPSLPNGVTYTVLNSRVRTTSPAAFIYYSQVIAPADGAFYIKVTQENAAGWPNLGNFFSLINPQVNVYTADCVRIKTITGIFMPSYITFKVPGALKDATYYVGIRYQADSVVGKNVGAARPEVPYTFKTLVGSTVSSATVLDPNTKLVTFHP